MDLFSQAPKPKTPEPVETKHKTRYDCGCRWDGEWIRCEVGKELLDVYFASFGLLERNDYFEHYKNNNENTSNLRLPTTPPSMGGLLRIPSTKGSSRMQNG